MGCYTFKKTQKIPAALNEVWHFISSPANLKKITPAYMGFDIKSSGLPGKMYPGMIIKYNITPLLGIKMLWVTEITHVSDYEFFVDEQRIGPYSFWHHQHRLEKTEGGVLMTDTVNYQPPLGFVGDIANSIIIKKQLKNIFDYRVAAIEKIFGKF